MRTTRRNSLARYRSIEGVRTSEIVYRGGHEEMRRGPPSFETRFPNYPDSSEKPAFTGVIWEKAMLQIACPAVIYPGSFHGRKGRKKRGGEGKKEEERRTRRRREFLAWWVLSIHDRRASCLFHGLTRVTKRHSF